MADNATSGKLRGDRFALVEHVVPPDGDVRAAARAALAEARILVVDVPADDLLAVADLPEAAGALLFNAGAEETRLRSADCRPHVFHTVPSRDMLADALMQVLARRQWAKVFLVEGPTAGDKAMAEAYRQAARKFGVKVAIDKAWGEEADLADNAAEEVPVFTQGKDYDVLVVADEERTFGQFILYNTWLPRPVAGSHGLMPVGWSPVIETWGAAQLQSRFRELAGRPMGEKDFAAWVAVRAVGEAVRQTRSADPAVLAAALRAPDFVLDGFKGRKLSFRDWNNQMRQPIPVVHDGAAVAHAPVQGFLHQFTELDTLGLDRPESKCKFGVKS